MRQKLKQSAFCGSSAGNCVLNGESSGACLNSSHWWKGLLLLCGNSLQFQLFLLVPRHTFNFWTCWWLGVMNLKWVLHGCVWKDWKVTLFLSEWLELFLDGNFLLHWAVMAKKMMLQEKWSFFFPILCYYFQDFCPSKLLDFIKINLGTSQSYF